MKVILELERTDFIPTEWALYDKGIKSLNSTMLKKDVSFRFNICNEAYIYIGKDKHYLKS